MQDKADREGLGGGRLERHEVQEKQQTSFGTAKILIAFFKQSITYPCSCCATCV